MKNSVFLKLDKGQRKENGWRGKHVDQLRIERCVSLEDHCPCLKQLSSKVSVKVVVTLQALPCPENLFHCVSLFACIPCTGEGKAELGESRVQKVPAWAPARKGWLPAASRTYTDGEHRAGLEHAVSVCSCTDVFNVVSSSLQLEFLVHKLRKRFHSVGAPADTDKLSRRREKNPPWSL